MPSFEELRQEAEWRRCAKDEVYWLENYWYIMHPSDGRILFKLRDAQRETLAKWNNQRYTIALKARQIGFSTLAGAHAVWLCFFHPDRYIVMLSKTENDAIDLLKKSKYGYRYLPDWMLKRGPKLIDDNLTKMSWSNESGIRSMQSQNDPARGQTVYLVIVDEWAFLPNPEEAWASIEPVTDLGGRVIGISTANGSGNFFHEFYVKARTGTSQFKHIFFPWWAASERGPDWYEEKKRSMLEWQLHQEYPQNDVECFVKSGNPVFDYDTLQAIECYEPEIGYLAPDGQRRAKFDAVDNGPLRVFEHPQDGHRYVIGADVSEGLEYGDFSVAHVIDTKTGLVAAVWHGKIDPDLFGSSVLWDLGWYYNCALVGPEVNNHGIATCLALQTRGYPNIYYRHVYDERTTKRGLKIGWRTQANTKPQAIDGLIKALRPEPEAEIILRDEPTVAELQTFVRDEKGKMHGSPFDDRVMSLAIANVMRQHSFTPEYSQREDRKWTLDWWLALDKAEDERDGQFVVGRHSARSTR